MPCFSQDILDPNHPDMEGVFWYLVWKLAQAGFCCAVKLSCTDFLDNNENQANTKVKV